MLVFSLPSPGFMVEPKKKSLGARLLYLAAALPLDRSSRPTLMRSRMFSRSLSSFSLVMTTLLGWMPRGTLWPEALSRVTRSMWIWYLRR